MNDFKQLMIEQFNVPEDKATVFSDRVSDYINQRVDTMVRKVQQDTLSKLTDPNRGDAEKHSQIVNTPSRRHGNLQSFSEFKSQQ